ncbi:flagellar basal body L-ring protein FlgH [Exilibacterium tricleocarpae]|uniref:Flagellar L-ring protein n=2 Tax=Exilibacterium tricleocarpae TaxID=2591008 RepID=A0A545U4E8_9GAMM|nr:flagellar basal body L-ring protein FlgH [Exilibacterium tricleocarpae]
MLLLLSGCVIQQPAAPGDPGYAPVLGPSQMPPPSTDGSLYREHFGLALFNDRKASRIGDILTVTLDERTTSTKSSTISIEKENAVSIDESDGSQGRLLGTTPSFKNLSLLTDLNQEREFTGEAGADQSNSLQGSITVTVADVLPNGNLVVRGEKWLTLNRGDEYIRISGIVRPEDVSTTNSVSSTRLANARISYSGTGALADSQKMGWIGRFFNSPYWPF